MKDELTLEEICGIIRQANAMGVEDIHITGGEPTTRTDLFEILRYAKENFSGKVRMISNSNRLTADYLARLKENGVEDMMLSLDGDTETHDFLRGRNGSYWNVITAARNAIQLGMNVRFSLVASKINLHTIKGEIQNAVNLGVKYFSVFIMSPVGRAQKMTDYLISPSEWVAFCDDLKKWYLEHGLEKRINLILEKGFQRKSELLPLGEMHGRGIGCTMIGENREYIMISPIGEVYPCVCFMNSRHSIGSIREHTLEELISSDDAWRYYLELQDKAFPCCTGCDSLDVCAGGCKGLHELGFDRICDKDYYQVCPLMKESYQNNKIAGSSEEIM